MNSLRGCAEDYISELNLSRKELAEYVEFLESNMRHYCDNFVDTYAWVDDDDDFTQDDLEKAVYFVACELLGEETIQQWEEVKNRIEGEPRVRLVLYEAYQEG